MAIRPGVSAIILTPEGLLLQRRSDNGLWGLPGGGVEPGESVSEAIVREVREETGLEVAPGRLVGVYSAPAIGQDRKSTRLNSSHLGISYAVFCLKKKKN